MLKQFDRNEKTIGAEPKATRSGRQQGLPTLLPPHPWVKQEVFLLLGRAEDADFGGRRSNCLSSALLGLCVLVCAIATGGGFAT